MIITHQMSVVREICTHVAIMYEGEVVEKGLVADIFANPQSEVAKELIRTNHMNFTQISAHLGYTSIHYFSRQFKKIVGMTPSEYASSVKAIAEGNAN